MATVHVDVSPQVLRWARDVGLGDEEVHAGFPKFDAWVNRQAKPTLVELTKFAKRAGVPFGFLLLKEPPAWALPIPDFREGYSKNLPQPSADLMAVLNQSLSRQDWYREYAERNGLPEVEIVGIASDWEPQAAADQIRSALKFELPHRRGTWNDTRKQLLRAFEDLGGLTVVTSMVGNNNKRLLDPSEFRGFALPDTVAPLVFVNANQTLNGQIFTLVHEYAHIWRGRGGIGNEDLSADAQSSIEKWCNDVASQVLVPQADLASRWPTLRHRSLPEALDAAASSYRCGSLVVLQALRRYGIETFDNFDATYRREEERVKVLAEGSRRTSGGDHYNNQPFRVGERLSHAIVGDTVEGHTSYSEGMKLMSMRSAMTFDEYARRLGVRP